MAAKKILGIVLVALACTVVPARSCGPDLPQAEFVSRRFPDDLKTFGKGKLGILIPTYYQRFLYIAYRQLADRPLTDDEVAQVSTPPLPLEEATSDGGKRWLAVRAEVLHQSPEQWLRADCAKQLGSNLFVYFPNVYEAAYGNAESTLRDRMRREGGLTPAVLDWFAAQEAVFDACSDTARPPSPAPAGSPAWLVQDRAYQVAAWNFYALKYDEAIEGFRAIAGDRASPYRDLAPYLIGRTLLRKAIVPRPYQAYDLEGLRAAEQQFETVMRETPDARLRASAGRLLDYARFRLHPLERLAQLNRALSAPRPGPELGRLVLDFTILLDRVTSDVADSLDRANPDDEIADWILTLQRGGYAHALERWRATKSTPWLVAALTHATAGGPETNELVAAAEGVKRGQPAYAMAAFHRARLLVGAGQGRKVGPLDSQEIFPSSSRNLVLALRMQLARGFDEFVDLAQRPSAGVTSYTEMSSFPPEPSNRPLFDTDGALMLNKWTPLDRLAEVATGPRLEDSLRANVALAAWTRAVLLDRHDVAARLAPVLASATYGLTPYLVKYRAATPASRPFESTWLLLHAYGATPWVRYGLGRFEPPAEKDPYRDNWWCVDDPSRGVWFLAPPDPNEETVRWVRTPGWDTKLAEAIFTPAERAAAQAELDRLVKLGSAPNYLCAQTLAWAKKAPKDPRLPEALHLCVMATRYGCADKKTSQWSKQAYQTLHSRFPKSPWAKRTRYWY